MVSQPSTPIESNGGAPPSGSFTRVIGVLVNPGPAFQSIAARPTWIVPILLTCIVSIGVIATFSYRVGWRSFMEHQFANNSRMEQMSPAQRDKAVDKAAKIAPIFAYVGGSVGTVISAVIAAGLLLAAFNLLASARIGFVTALSIVAYGWMPFVVSGLLGIVLLLIKDPSTVELEHLVASSVGAFISNDAPKWLQALTTSLDLFTFWAIALLAIGFNKANPRKVSLGKSFAIVIGMWVFYLVLKVSWVGAFS